MQSLDINITGIDIQEKGNNIYSIFVQKKCAFGEKQLPFDLESCGTKEIFQLILLFLKNNNENCIYFIDELDSHLHTKILRYFIKLFTSQKQTKSQLIYTSHDMPTLDKELFRRDEIYFAALNESYFTDLISLYEFGDAVRPTQSYSNIYLSSKIGYDPYIDYSLKGFYGK